MRILPALLLSLPVLSCAAPRTPEPPAPLPPTAAQLAEAGFQVIPLRYAVASELAATLRGLVDPGRTSIVADGRTNSLIVRSAPEGRAAIEAVVKALDVQVPRP